MLNFQLTIAIIVGKILIFFLRLTGTGGTAGPGLLVLKIRPNLIKDLSRQLEKNILITGTNGKTTTARMVASIFKEADIKFIHNRHGSNLLRGIASTLVKNASLLGKMPLNSLGLWEADEFAFLPACMQVKPQIVLITNLFRDQLDRYGEIDTVASKWQKAIEKLSLKSPKSLILLNADDATVASLGRLPKRSLSSEVTRSTKYLEAPRTVGRSGKVLYFGLSDKKLGTKKPDHASDATVCPYCFSALSYKTCFVGHMGIYSCPKCEQIQPNKNVYLKKVKVLKGKDKQEVIVIARTPINIGGRSNLISNRDCFADARNDKKLTISFTTTLPGTYNLYNFVAATALATALNIPKKTIEAGLSSFTPAFGRVEKVKVGEKTLNIFLVKNPTGFNEVIDTLVSNRKHALPKITCLIALNDLIADGTDVSWIWDVDFEKLTPKLKKVIVSGFRAYDMALRFKYSQKKLSQNKSGSGQAIKQFSNIAIEPNLKKAVQLLLKTNDQRLYILPTYTAMLEIRKILARMGLVHSSWED